MSKKLLPSIEPTDTLETLRVKVNSTIAEVNQLRALSKAKRLDKLLRTMARSVAQTDPKMATAALAESYRSLWLNAIKKSV